MAVYFSAATGDAIEATQDAINKVQETTGAGIVLVAEGLITLPTRVGVAGHSCDWFRREHPVR